MAIGKISTNTRIALSLGDSWASCWLLLCLVRMSQHLLSLFLDVIVNFMPSVLWHCWLGGRKCIRPVKNWAVGCWCGYLSGARWRLAYGPADATATHCLSKIQICFAFLVSAHLGSPGQRAIQRVCVCVCTCQLWPMILTLELDPNWVKTNHCVTLTADFMGHTGSLSGWITE